MTPDLPLLRRSWQSWITSDMERAGPYWLQLVWTALFSATLALVFTLLGFLTYAGNLQDWLDPQNWARWYGRNLVACAVIGFLIHGLFEIGGRWLGPARIKRFSRLERMAFFAGIPILGVAVGWPLAAWLVLGDLSTLLARDRGWRAVVWSVGFTLLITFVLYHWFGTKAKALEAERRATEAQLRLLQAQIEPHFLFNTLANVQSLIDHDAPKAKAMLAAFTEYLRGSLTTLRRDVAPLADELALADAYLRVQQSRMEERLRFRFEVDATTTATLLPPLLLQPLVENAIHHGLEPQLDGGEVSITARRQGQTLLLQVRDDGRGLSAPSRKGNGVALVNLRERLHSHYGGAASLSLTDAHPGTLAELRLPLEEPAP